MKRGVVFAGLALCLAGGLSAAEALVYSLGGDSDRAVKAETAWTKELGYGLDAGIKAFLVPAKGEAPAALKAEKSFYFSASLPEEGNYRVTVDLGNAEGESLTWVKAELSRLMAGPVVTKAGETRRVRFIVNTRTPKFPVAHGVEGGQVKLKSPRESTQEAWAWDRLLTLEFAGSNPSASKVCIDKIDTVPTVYLLGDSTVCDQSRAPYASWGQMLTYFLKDGVAVANHAESGETLRDSIGRRRLDKIRSLLRPGDYLVVQFGHNDQKQIAKGEGGPFTTYKEELRRHVQAARERGAIPVVVTPMERRGMDANSHTVPTLADYAEAVRQVAKEEKVALVDLNAMSIKAYEAIEKGGKGRVGLFFAGDDRTHHCNYGAWILAKCVARSFVDAGLPIASQVKPEAAAFDPSKPEQPESVLVPPSLLTTEQRPLGD